MITTLRHHIAATGKMIRTRLAQRRLANLVAAKAQSYEITDFKRRRAAAIRGRAIQRMRAHG